MIKIKIITAISLLAMILIGFFFIGSTTGNRNALGKKYGLVEDPHKSMFFFKTLGLMTFEKFNTLDENTVMGC